MRKFLPVILLVFTVSPRLYALPGDVLKDLPAPGKNCAGLAHDGKSIWVADHALDQLLAVDPRTGKVQRRLKSPGYRPGGLAFDGQDLWNVDVKEWNDQIVFLHQIVPGAADKSYGIHVAQLAGVPQEVNTRASEILQQLESQHLDEHGQAKTRPQVPSR